MGDDTKCVVDLLLFCFLPLWGSFIHTSGDPQQCSLCMATRDTGKEETAPTVLTKAHRAARQKHEVQNAHGISELRHCIPRANVDSYLFLFFFFLRALSFHFLLA